MKRTKNAGLTLVELLVSIAVLSIVTLGIGGLLRLAAEQYSNATKETEVQNQAQSVFASVSNSLEDVAIDVTFSSDRLTIVNNDGIIMFEKDGDRLYYDEKTYSSMSVADDADDDTKKAAATSATIGKNQENILADHVTAFSVDTSTKDQGFVVVSLTITIQERSKSMVQNVFMRNLRPKGSAVLLNNATVVPTNAPTTLNNPLTSLTGPAGDGPGGTTNPPSPTLAPTNTPTPEPTGVDNGNTMVASNQHVYNDGKSISFTLDRSLNGTNSSYGLVITKNARNLYIIHGVSDNVKQLFQSAQENGDTTIPSMPGFNWGPEDFALTEDQIAWLKQYYGIDLATSCPATPLPEGAEIPSQSNLTGLVYTVPQSQANVTAGSWNGKQNTYTISCGSGNDPIYEVEFQVTGANNTQLNNIENGNGKYQITSLGGGKFRVTYSANYDTTPNDTIKPVIQIPWDAQTGNISVTVTSIKTYVED